MVLEKLSRIPKSANEFFHRSFVLLRDFKLVLNIHILMDQ